MISFTKQERTVLFCLALIMFAGSMVGYAFKQYPQLKDIVNVVDGDELYPKVDINTATYEELVALPYIGPYTGEQIVYYRQTQGPFTSLEQLKQVKGVKEKNFEKFVGFLKIK